MFVCFFVSLFVCLFVCSHWSKTGWDPSSLRRISGGGISNFPAQAYEIMEILCNRVDWMNRCVCNWHNTSWFVFWSIKNVINKISIFLVIYCDPIVLLIFPTLAAKGTILNFYLPAIFNRKCTFCDLLMEKFTNFLPDGCGRLWWRYARFFSFPPPHRDLILLLSFSTLAAQGTILNF